MRQQAVSIGDYSVPVSPLNCFNSVLLSTQLTNTNTSLQEEMRPTSDRISLLERWVSVITSRTRFYSEITLVSSAAWDPGSGATCAGGKGCFGASFMVLLLLS